MREIIEKTTTIRLNPWIIDEFKANNNELLDELKSKLPKCEISLFEDYIQLETSTNEANNYLSIVDKFINECKKRLENQLHECKYKNLRVVMKSGLKPHAILIDEDFIRLNLSKLSLDVNREKLENSLEFSIHDCKFDTKPHNSGFIITNSVRDAQYLVNNNHLFGINSQIFPSFNINGTYSGYEKPALKLTWFISESNDIAILKFKPNANLNEICDKLNQRGFIARTSNKDGNGKIIVLSVRYKDNFLDEIDFRNYVYKFEPLINNCIFPRQKVTEKCDIQNVKEKLYEQLKQYDLIDNIDKINILPQIRFDDGSFKPQMTAYIEYEDYENACKAIGFLNGKIGVLGTGRLHLSFVFKKTFKIDKYLFDKIYQKQFENIKKRIETEFDGEIMTLKTLNNQNLKFRLLSSKYNEFHESINLLNELLEPLVIRMNSNELEKLSNLFYTNKYLIDLESKENSFVQIDLTHCQLIIYGPNRHILYEKLREYLASIQNYSYYEMPLKAFDEFYTNIIRNDSDMCRLMKNAFFEGSQVELNLRTKTATLSFDKMLLQKVHNKLSEMNTFKAICGICMLNIDIPFELATCGHQFCNECVQRQFSYNLFECTTCNKGFSIADIWKLSDNDYKLLNAKCLASSEKHIQCNGYIICKACDYPCKINNENKSYFCRYCNISYCNECDNHFHGKISCEFITKDFQLYKQYVNENAKKCPKCNVVIEKNDGCNHMICTQCDCNFCWECQIEFSQSEIVYHVRNAHQNPNVNNENNDVINAVENLIDVEAAPVNAVSTEEENENEHESLFDNTNSEPLIVM